MSKAIKVLLSLSIVLLFVSVSVTADDIQILIPELNSVESETLRTRELYGRDQEYLVEGFTGSAATLRVRITTNGALVFESYCCVERTDALHIVWKYREGEDWTIKSATRPTEFQVGLSNMVGAAKDIVRMSAPRSSRPRDVESLDNWGCDIPDWLGGRAIECSHKGNCCDTHDECYAQYGCGAWSWLTGASTRSASCVMHLRSHASSTMSAAHGCHPNAAICSTAANLVRVEVPVVA